jgi:L-asparaginase II
MGVKINLTENLNLRIKTLGTLDMTNPENKDWKLASESRYGTGNPVNRSRTYLINAGLSISTYYIFD